MSGHTVFHRAPGVSLKAHVVIDEIAAIKRRRRAGRTDAITALLFEGRNRIWVTEEAARLHRRRSLIDDNPASG